MLTERAANPIEKKPKRDHTIDDLRDVRDTCKRLVEKLPSGKFRDAIEADANLFAKTLMELCPRAPYLQMQLEIIGTNRCCRWHQDFYVGRMVVTYNEPGTWLVDDGDVNFHMFEDLVGVPNEMSDPLIVPDYASIHRTAPNDVSLIKGNMWPSIERSVNGMGVVHKSPNMREDAEGLPLRKRFALKVDLSFEPHEDTEDDDNDDENDGDV